MQYDAVLRPRFPAKIVGLYSVHYACPSPACPMALSRWPVCDKKKKNSHVISYLISYAKKKKVRIYYVAIILDNKKKTVKKNVYYNKKN